MSVRITQGSVNRSYLKNLNKSNHAMNQSMEKIETGRAFNRVSDNVPDATRAMDVRVRLYKNEQMQDNVNTAIEQLSMAEDAIGEMGDICSGIYSDMLRALNGSNLTSSKEAFLASLEGSKEEILRLANTDYNNKYVMGGTGTAERPFKDDGSGNMEFNGAKLSEVMNRSQTLNAIDSGKVPVNCTNCPDGENCFEITGSLNSVSLMLDKELHGVIPKVHDNIDSSDSSYVNKFIQGGEVDADFNAFDPDKADQYHVYYHENGVNGNGEAPHISIHLSDPYESSLDEKEKAELKNGVSGVPENYFMNGKPVYNSRDNYMDIGLDMDGGRVINSKNSFKMSVDGIATMGFGKSVVTAAEMNNLVASAASDRDPDTGLAEGDYEVSNNIYDMMSEMQKAIEDEDVDRLSAVLVNFKKQTDNLITSRSEIGVRSKYLDTTLNRLENENVSLNKMQSDLEGVDEATEITKFLNYQNAWNLTLRFGGNVIPKSLMDYV